MFFSVTIKVLSNAIFFSVTIKVLAMQSSFWLRYFEVLNNEDSTNAISFSVAII